MSMEEAKKAFAERLEKIGIDDIIPINQTELLLLISGQMKDVIQRMKAKNQEKQEPTGDDLAEAVFPLHKYLEKYCSDETVIVVTKEQLHVLEGKASFSV